ncbi:MAG: hypothetical protein HDS22_05260, partial [Bacteroides sp.]|nr:hypothetical protein [Bacteroides sp.]
LVQKNKKGEIIGGESFMIEAPGKSLSILDIGKETSEEGKTILSVNNDDVSSVKWFDEAGDIIGEASSIEIEGGLESRHYTAVGFTESGEAATGNITIEKDFGISRLNVDRKSVDIDFINPTPANSSIEIVPIDYLKNVIATEVENGAQSVTINDAGIEKGIYTVRYLIEGTLVDSRKIMIND